MISCGLPTIDFTKLCPDIFFVENNNLQFKKNCMILRLFPFHNETLFRIETKQNLIPLYMISINFLFSGIELIAAFYGCLYVGK